MRSLAIAVALALGLTACSSPASEPTDRSTTRPSPTAPTPTASGSEAAFTVTSPDFTAGEQLPDWATANAFAGQCAGDNLNPGLTWTNVPEGTQAFAITFIDRSANNYLHWVQFDIPGDLTGIERGKEASDGGVEGATAQATPGYFGPCPPGPDHRYEFTVYALDAPLGLEEGARFADVKAAIDEHLLAQASISGMRSGPA